MKAVPRGAALLAALAGETDHPNEDSNGHRPSFQQLPDQSHASPAGAFRSNASLQGFVLASPSLEVVASVQAPSDSTRAPLINYLRPEPRRIQQRLPALSPSGDSRGSIDAGGTMKQSWQCIKCRGRRVGYLGTVADSGQRGLYSRKIGEAVGDAVLGMRVLKPVGEIEAFVCTDCGYFEEYIKDPGSIDWNSIKGFRWCHPEVAGPSRG